MIKARLDLQTINKKTFLKTFDYYVSSIKFYFEKHIFIGVSGGPDSMLLSFLLNYYTKKYKWNLTAIIIDHGLRLESCDEALKTQNRLEKMGIEGVIVKLDERKNSSKIQEWARFERLNNLGAIAKSKNGILVLGHHLNDQAETIFMRMIRNTGFCGASGIKPIVLWYGTPIIRPLLGFSKDGILQACNKYSVQYEIDKSNFNQKFERVRIRNSISKLQDSSILLKQIYSMTNSIGKICEVVDKKTNDFCGKSFPVFDLGWGQLDIPLLSRLNVDLATRILSMRIKTIGGHRYFVKKDKITLLLNHFKRFKNKLFSMPGKTLGGCKFCYRKKTIILVRWTNQKIEKKIMPPLGNLIFDNRWEVFSKKNIVIGHLNDLEARKIKKILDKNKTIPWEVWRYVPVNIEVFNSQKINFYLDDKRPSNHLSIGETFFSKLFSEYEVKIKLLKH
mgnify:CR=1 FL=1